MTKAPRKQERFAGILLHPTSLPGRSGIGDLGRPARQFVDFLKESAQTLWQICPLGPTGYGDSPYSALSAFAGNPMLISFESLVDDGLMDRAELDAFPKSSPEFVDYERVNPAKRMALETVAERFAENASGDCKSDFETFCAERADWLDDYALFMALKTAFDGAPWTEWDTPLARREPAALEAARAEHAPAIERHKVQQFLFWRQWTALRKYANGSGVRVIGDAPIFVSHDSADVWARPEMFFLDDAGRPTVVAGVPPDYFSEDGQRWGNPLYRWKVMAEDGYAWWVARLRAAFELVDIVRLDHFRGFEAYWETPADEPTAKNGRWVKGPGAAFFERLREEFGELPIIAEDLGVITPKVDALRRKFDLPGMKVLQFAFGGDAHNFYLPHNVERRSVIYTGTHDNDTTLGWYEETGEKTRDHVRRYLWCDGADVHLDLIRAAMMSHAAMAIVPLQDILGLGGEARMNTPGHAEGNWKWRFTAGELDDGRAESLRQMTELYGRAPLSPEIDDISEADPSFDPDQAGEA